MRTRAWLKRIDPAPDDAEPLTPLPLVTLAVLTTISTALFMWGPAPPMQDLGHHAAVTAVVAGYNKAGSLYPALYHPLDPLGVNSLLYTVSGYLGRVLPPAFAFRASIASYHALTPLATLYTLRVFGRSPWAAVASIPVLYNLSYVFGFVNFLVAAPLSIASIGALHRLLREPTWGRFARTALLIFLLALAHVHVFAWTGVLLGALALAHVIAAIGPSLTVRRGPGPLKTAAFSALVVTPAMAIFARWYLRILRGPAPDEYVIYHAEKPTAESYKTSLKPIAQSLRDLGDFTSLTTTDDDARLLVFLLACAVVALVLRLRAGRVRHWPVLELCAIVTGLSYFFIPEHYGGQAVIASRQIGFALWFAPVFFDPPPAKGTRVPRLVVVGLTVWLAVFRLATWSEGLRGFWKETAGLEAVLRAAPKNKRLQYNNMEPGSRYFRLGTFRHVEKLYMLYGFGQCDDNPALGTMSAIRYRSTFVRGALPVHAGSWPRSEELWRDFELLLVHKWRPSNAELEAAKAHGDLVIKRGDWELWQRRAP